MTHLVKYLCCCFFVIGCCINIQSGWFPVATGTSSALNSICFPASGSGNIGYIAGTTGKILFTPNAGNNWTAQPCPTTNDLNSIFFVSNQVGWASGALGTIIFTSNGGLNWTIQSTPVSDLLYSICFVNQYTGWSVGQSGTILHTSNSGMNWQIQNSGAGDYLRSVVFTGASSGTAVGRNGRIIRTTNGGINWIDVSPGLSSTLYSVYYTNQLTGWAVGFGSLITTNGGNNWSIQQGSGIYFSVYFPGAGTGWRAGAGGTIDVTTNSGYNWSSQTTNTSNWLYSLAFTSINTGYCAGENGTLLKTTDGGGILGLKQISNSAPQRFELLQNYPNPFNPATKIRFDVPSISERHAFDLQLVIYDILGRKVAVLVNEQLQPGTYEASWDAAEFSSGTYFYRVTADKYTETKKMILIK